MKKNKNIIIAFLGIILLSIPVIVSGEEAQKVTAHQERQINIKPLKANKTLKRFVHTSGYDFEYPDAVRGIYVTGNSAGGSRFDSLVELVDRTDLNTMVIDVKEDNGNLTFTPEKGSPYEEIAKDYIDNPKKMMKVLEEKGIYPIARVVVFKDSVLAKKRPDLSFTKNGKVWVNGKGEAFVSPFQKEVWEYNVEIGKMAASMGFQEIQFDYVRFPEGFEHRDKELEYSLGDYEDLDMNNIKKRVKAVTDFVHYAKEELNNYDVDVSVDIFGYAATIEETPGIGQNFSKIAENVDIISSMIYPSHWSSYFGIEKPDTEPYKLVNEYAKVENKVLGKLDDAPISRPWIQDFEAPWLYSGATKQYGKAEVEAQIKALYENGINEFLLWNAGNSYTENVDYKLGK
ncbi:MAG: putative glycoside hydrolase [Bacillota bacterium]|uniref:putative glycoside hydrolase n=1 Tax=Virgibacillus TaxID=84406 RepID=UPI0004269599|nr:MULTISPECIES: putative glycoside hydrolase [Bacillaceae]MCC2251681.1 putative glycoside hydrolase [Virgibacillus sp. AGTR]MDY7045425.1 putative glycoside hydrolase [Virgibacillus sp. M23]WBX79975.1 putative glycoside hydrolase [Virgibacillus salarius]